MRNLQDQVQELAVLQAQLQRAVNMLECEEEDLPDAHHITRAALCSMCAVRQACPGPWQHAMTWGLRQYCQQVNTTADMQSMEAAASCKTSRASAQKVVDANLLHHSIVRSNMPEKWQDALRLELGWRVGTHLCITYSGSFYRILGT